MKQTILTQFQFEKFKCAGFVAEGVKIVGFPAFGAGQNGCPTSCW
jgi:hypothetical protein